MMNMLIVLFEICLFLNFAYMGTIGMSVLKTRYFYRVPITIVIYIIGIALDKFHLSDHRANFYTGIGLIPLLYLGYYELLRRLLKPWIGEYPYTPFRQRNGEVVFGYGYPKNRKVKSVDQWFSVILFILPFVTLLLIDRFILYK